MSRSRDKTRLGKRQFVPEAEQHASMKIVADDNSRWESQVPQSRAPIAGETAESSQGVLNHSSFDAWLSTFTPNTGTAVEMPAALEEYELDADGDVTTIPSITKPPVLQVKGSTPNNRAPFPYPVQHDVSQVGHGNCGQLPNVAGNDRDQISTAAPKDPLPLEEKIKQHQSNGPEDDGAISLTIGGLRKDGVVQAGATTFRISSNITMTQLNHLIASKGFERPLGIRCSSNSDILEAMQGISTPCPVMVTLGPSNHCIDAGLRINVDEPMQDYLGRLRNLVECDMNELSLNCGDLIVRFHRTLRVPEDRQVYDLPADFGQFPLQSVAPYISKLKAASNPDLTKMAAKGGVFFPMYQREAMWISFQARHGKHFRIKVLLGGVNAVSGLKWDVKTVEQDYLLVPPQKHLHGIKTEHETVRQFVAMPTGMGYSVEKQILGNEDRGGLQIEITQDGRPPKMGFLRLEEKDSVKSSLLEWGSPRQHRLQPGTYIMLNNPSLIARGHRRAPEDSERAFQVMRLMMNMRTSLVRELRLPPGQVWGTDLEVIASYKTHVKIRHGILQNIVSDTQRFPWDTVRSIRHNAMVNGQSLYDSDLDLYLNGERLQDNQTIGQLKGSSDGVILAAKRTQIDREFRQEPRDTCLNTVGIFLAAIVCCPCLVVYSLSGRQKKSTGAPIKTSHDSGVRIGNVNSYAMQQGTCGMTRPFQPGSEFPTRTQGFSAVLPPSPLRQALPIEQRGEEFLERAAPASDPNQSTPQHFYGRTPAKQAPPMSYAPHFASRSYIPPRLSAISDSLEPPSGNRRESLRSPGNSEVSVFKERSRDEDILQYPSRGRGTNSHSSLVYNRSYNPDVLSAHTVSDSANFGREADTMAGEYYHSEQKNTNEDEPFPDGRIKRETTRRGYREVDFSDFDFLDSDYDLVAAGRKHMEVDGLGNKSTIKPQVGNTQGATGRRAISSSTELLARAAPTVILNEHQNGYSPEGTDSFSRSRPQAHPRAHWSMGISAGGYIRQQILADRDYGRLWDLTSSTLVNIQILNSVAYESLTSMLAPATPIDANTYLRQGIPFYELFDERTPAVGGAAPFAAIRTVGDLDASNPIEIGSSLTKEMKVGCTCCRKNLCDAILRPCNHTFCSACICGPMFQFGAVRCWMCGTHAEQTVGFSAPMSLPGEEKVDLSSTWVISLTGIYDKKNVQFRDAVEMPAYNTDA